MANNQSPRIMAENSKAGDLAPLKHKLHQMQKQLTFVRFEIQQRKHSPNVVIGITEVGTAIFVAAPGTALGKQRGDQLAIQIKAMLEREYLLNKFELQQQHTPILECPECNHLQSHGYPKSGKLYCAGCGAMLEDITDELELLSCPGDHIKETMAAMGFDMPVFARSMNMNTEEAIFLLTGQTTITPDIANRLQRVLNVDAQFWLNLETNYRNKLAQLISKNAI